MIWRLVTFLADLRYRFSPNGKALLAERDALLADRDQLAEILEARERELELVAAHRDMLLGEVEWSRPPLRSAR